MMIFLAVWIWVVVSFGDAWRCRGKYQGFAHVGLENKVTWFLIHLGWTPIKIVEYFIKGFVRSLDHIRKNMQ